jgi:GDP-mannose 6-dehydrogenase
MNISVFGLGYVGCVSIGCLAEMGHFVIGVDISKTKVDLINQGKPTIIEDDIGEILVKQFSLKKVRASQDYIEAVRNSEVSYICVGTPSTSNGQLDLSHVYKTAEQIGEGLQDKKGFHCIVIRSTVFPGTNEKVGEILSKTSGKIRNIDFAVISNPEFMREGTAVKDFFHPPYTVIGTDSEKGFGIMLSVYKAIDAPVERAEIKVAEFIKYINNSFHALKITYANEIGKIAKVLEMDSHELMDLFCKDRQLNISPAYLKPGFAYGGSCLPKDLKALKTIAHDNYIETPLIDSIETSNSKHIDHAFQMILSKNQKKIGILGLAFKTGTDDLRNSPMVELVEKMMGKGLEIRIFDSNINTAMLIGSNREYIISHLPHFTKLLNNELNEVISLSDILIINHSNKEFESLPVKYPDKYFIDFARITLSELPINYEGIGW